MTVSRETECYNLARELLYSDKKPWTYSRVQTRTASASLPVPPRHSWGGQRWDASVCWLLYPEQGRWQRALSCLGTLVPVSAADTHLEWTLSE